jgi:flavin reductase
MGHANLIETPVGGRPATTVTTQVEPRLALRRLTTGVTVLTVGSGDSAHGTTASSVAAIGQDPPLVCAALRQGSSCTQMILEHGQFAVNVLSSRQAGLADWFANPARPRGAHQFDPVHRRIDEATGLPLLQGCVAVLICRLVHVLPAADRDVLIAEVLEAHQEPGVPLVNFAGALHLPELRDAARPRGARDPSGAATVSLE